MNACFEVENYMSNPLLSIITINYNNREGLRKTLDSVKSQKMENFEHIIVDGGSTDGSVDVIKEFLLDPVYSKHVAWWCSEKDGGIYNAINKGIKKSMGKWIYILNSGDFLIDNVLTSVELYLREHGDKILYGAVDCYRNDKYIWTSCKTADMLDTGMIPHQGVFVSRTIHDNYGYYDENLKILADWDFFLRIKRSNCSFQHIPLIISIYDETGISSIQSKLYEKEFDILQEKYSLSLENTNKIKSLLKSFIPPVFISLYQKVKIK